MQVKTAGTCISLAKFCRKFTLDEKIFVVPSYRIGHQIGERLAIDDSAWINLRFVTPASFALEVAGLEISSSGLHVISSTAAFFLVERIFTQLDQDNQLAYFTRLKTSPGILHAVVQALGNLRKAGHDAGTLQPDYFENKDKGRDIRLILKQYELELAKKNIIDAAGLFILAQKIAAKKKDKKNFKLLILSDLVLSEVERAFIITLAGGRLLPVLRSVVFGLPHPTRFLNVECCDEGKSAKALDSDAARLPWLFAPPKKKPESVPDGSVEIFKALGPGNECREVIRRILQNQIPLDSVEIIQPPGEDYSAIFYLLCDSLNLPASFAGGIPLRFSRPGKYFAGLLDWLENDYPVTILSSLLESGVIDLPSPTKAGLYLKQAGIGWGRERYSRCLAEMTAVCKDPAEVEVMSGLNNFVLDLLECIPAEGQDGKVDLSSLCAGLAVCLDKYAQKCNDQDLEAGALLKQIMLEATGSAASRHSQKDALERLRDLTKRLSTGASGPLPGSLYFSDYNSGGYIGRRVNYIMGLEQNVFPGTGIQDPILLDEEREKISPSLPTVTVLLQERLFVMARMISALRGNITFSYPSYNILDNKSCFPSSLILQAFRLLEGNSGLDYSALQNEIGDSYGFSPERIDKVLDGTDWWLTRLIIGEKLENGLTSIGRFFPELMQGYKALSCRLQEPLTEYDGSVGADIRSLDPIMNQDLIMSATRLETLAECPFKYLLQYILEVRPPEDVEYDPAHWLNARQRGLLLHDIFYRFMQSRNDQSGKISFKRHSAPLRVLGDKVISEFRDKIPPPSPGIFEQERIEIFQALGIFLKVESQREELVEPALFEVFFGLEKQEGKGVAEAVEIKLGQGGSFLLRGQIDRIDRLGDNRFRVLDYKTGSYKKYEDLKYFGRGKITQHALYGIAAEQILVHMGMGEDPKVVESGYFFPTQRGDGYEILIKELDRSRLSMLLLELIEIIKRGEFIHSYDARCDYCDFFPVCGKKAQEKAKMWRDSSLSVFEIIKNLREYS